MGDFAKKRAKIHNDLVDTVNKAMQNIPDHDLEQELLADLAHSLKLMPSSQRELFVSEIAQYITQREQAAFNAAIDAAIGALDGVAQENIMQMTVDQAKEAIESLRKTNGSK